MVSDTSIQRYFGKDVRMDSLQRDIGWRRRTGEKMAAAARSCRVRGLRGHCPICRGDHFSPLVTVYGFDYALCDACGHVFYRQMPDPEDIKRIYDGETEYLRHFVAEEIFAARVGMIDAPKVNFVARAIGRAAGDEWLDIGCGGCGILYAAKEAGYGVRGIDAGKLAVEQAAKLGISVARTYLTGENAGSLIGSPGVCSIFMMLEHLENPFDLLEVVTRHLPTNARLVIEVPRHPSVSAFSVQCFPALNTRQFVVPDHIHIFSEQSLQILLERLGYQITHMWTYGQDFYEAMSMMSQAGGREIDSWPKNLLAAVNEVQSVLDKHGLGDSMLIIAEKKANA